jgi:uncharacterized protein YndB with AHSA1/START domain
MKGPLVLKSKISIQAPPARVWDVLVNPEHTKKYMFGCEALSDWKVGSPLLWKGVFEGQELVAVKGEIVKIEPGKLLSYTTIDPNTTAYADIPENYLTVTYELEPQNGGTVLTVTQGDFATVADGQQRYDEVNDGGQGWDPLVAEIKKVAEAQ